MVASADTFPDRLETIKELDGLSEQARLHAVQRNRGATGMAAAALAFKEPMSHVEHMVSRPGGYT